jgi:heme oxygenase
MVCSEVIKAATNKLHAEAEAVLIRRIKGIQHVEDYIELLALFFGFFAPVEKLICNFIHSNVLPDIATRRKSGSIIKSLGSGTLIPVAAPCFLPPIHNLAEAFGAMYVLEGSTLGGKIISRMLRENGMVQLSSQSLAFFDFYGDCTFEMWAGFKTAINALLISETDIKAATQTAGDTFSKMKTWMQNANS